MRPSVVLFDLNGTLTDPAAIGAPWQAPGLGRAALSLAVQSAMVDSLTGSYRPFAEHVAAAVEVEARRRGLDLEGVSRATEAASRLPPFPDARPALELLREAGLPLAVLTNSGAESGRATLEASGLYAFFDQVLGVDAVERVKPHPETYAHARQALGAGGADLMLVAAHAWDVTGARRAGLRTCWIARGEEHLLPTAEPPDLRAADLMDAARQIREAVRRAPGA